MPGKTFDLATLLLRLAAAAIFLPHGWSKIAGEGGASAFAADMAAGYGIPLIFGHAAAWSEVAGAVLLAAGLFTRVDALLLAGTMAVAAFVVQLPDALYGVPAGAIKFFAVMREIELPVAMLATTLALVLVGGGRWSLDHVLRLEERARGMLRWSGGLTARRNETPAG